MDELSQLSQLTLSEIRERLNDRGIKVANSTLSEIISTGDVADQLQKQKVGNKTLFPVEAVDVLAEVIQIIRADSRLTWQSASDVMHRVLTRDGTAISVIRETPKDAELQVLSEIRELLKERQSPPEDEVYTLTEAKEKFPRFSYAILRDLRVKIGNRLYVRRSDCLRVIQEAKKGDRK
jgi:hypothetical protein